MGLIVELNKVTINSKEKVALEFEQEGTLSYKESSQRSDSIANSLKDAN